MNGDRSTHRHLRRHRNGKYFLHRKEYRRRGESGHRIESGIDSGVPVAGEFAGFIEHRDGREMHPQILKRYIDSGDATSENSPATSQ